MEAVVTLQWEWRCHHGGDYVDPLHQLAAEEAVVAVDVFGEEDLHLFGAGFGDGFHGTGLFVHGKILSGVRSGTGGSLRF